MVTAKWFSHVLSDMFVCWVFKFVAIGLVTVWFNSSSIASMDERWMLCWNKSALQINPLAIIKSTWFVHINCTAHPFHEQSDSFFICQLTLLTHLPLPDRVRFHGASKGSSQNIYILNSKSIIVTRTTIYRFQQVNVEFWNMDEKHTPHTFTYRMCYKTWTLKQPQDAT